MTALVRPPRHFSPQRAPRLAPSRKDNPMRVTTSGPGGGTPFQTVSTSPLPSGGTPFQTVSTSPLPGNTAIVGTGGGDGWWGGGWWGYGRAGCGWWGCGGYYPWVGPTWGPWTPFGYPIAAMPGPWVATSAYGWTPPLWTPAAWGPWPFGYTAGWSWY